MAKNNAFINIAMYRKKAGRQFPFQFHSLNDSCTQVRAEKLSASLGKITKITLIKICSENSSFFKYTKTSSAGNKVFIHIT